jgi:CRP/FNR family transcriptional regulator
LYDDRQTRLLFPFWGRMTPSQQAYALSKLITKPYERGTHIYLPHEPEVVWGVAKGRLTVTLYAEDGKQIRLLGVSQGDCGVAGGDAEDSQPDYYMEIFAEVDTEICVLPGPYDHMIPVEELYKCERAWNRRMVLALTNLAGRLAFSTLEERMVRYLREYCVQQHMSTVHITHEKLAEELGTSREVVSRLLTQLSKAGMVELKRKQIRLC